MLLITIDNEGANTTVLICTMCFELYQRGFTTMAIRSFLDAATKPGSVKDHIIEGLKFLKGMVRSFFPESVSTALVASTAVEFRQTVMNATEFSRVLGVACRQKYVRNLDTARVPTKSFSEWELVYVFEWFPSALRELVTVMNITDTRTQPRLEPKNHLYVGKPRHTCSGLGQNDFPKSFPKIVFL